MSKFVWFIAAAHVAVAVAFATEGNWDATVWVVVATIWVFISEKQRRLIEDQQNLIEEMLADMASRVQRSATWFTHRNWEENK